MAFDPNSPATGHSIQSDVTATRTSLNALRSCEASATEPSNLVAGMFWFDTSANVLKLRDEANTAWQNVWDFGNNRLPLNVLAPGELTADAGGRAKMADLFVTNAKVNDVALSKITPVSIISVGTQVISAGGNWVPPAGIYFFADYAKAGKAFLEIYYGPSAGWYANGDIGGETVLGLMFCDGTNMRIREVGGSSAVTIVYHKYN